MFIPEVASEQINTPKPTINDAFLTERAISPYETKQSDCLNELWSIESNWEAGRINIRSNAVGIPQALPPTKIYPDFYSMPKVWRNGKLYLANPDRDAEIAWGLLYIQERYGTACNALKFEIRYNYY